MCRIFFKYDHSIIVKRYIVSLVASESELCSASMLWRSSVRLVNPVYSWLTGVFDDFLFLFIQTVISSVHILLLCVYDFVTCD